MPRVFISLDAVFRSRGRRKKNDVCLNLIKRVVDSVYFSAFIIENVLKVRRSTAPQPHTPRPLHRWLFAPFEMFSLYSSTEHHTQTNIYIIYASLTFEHFYLTNLFWCSFN